jgi:carboxypeptidase Q
MPRFGMTFSGNFMNKHWAALILASAVSLTLSCQAEDAIDGSGAPDEIYESIRADLATRSTIEKNLRQLSDVYGPRLTGTPRYVEMVAWVESRIREWGIDDVRVEVYGDGDRGWEIESYSAVMTAPAFANLNVQPVCCSRSTNDEVAGVPIIVDFYDLEALRVFDGQLRGKILLHPEVTQAGRPPTGRWSDERLLAAAERVEAITPDGLDGPGSDVSYVERLRRREEDTDTTERDIAEFLLEQGVGAVLRSSSAPSGLVNNRFDSGIVEFHGTSDPRPVPFFVLPREQHERLLTLLDNGDMPELALHLETRYYEAPEYHVNLIAEIPGSDPELKDEVVMLGAHLDSVETATGAADNGIGSATSMEVLRLIKSLGLRPRRTIRVALWGGEEQGLKGSSAYMKQHIGDIMTGEFVDEHERISGYFNHDNNGHDIRGIFTVGHEDIKSIFKPIFKTFEAAGASTVTIENAGGTDILVFDASGIPSFEWIHDPEMYMTHQLHTSLDVPAMVNIESANRNAAIIATVIYETAMLDEMLPRKKVDQIR